MFDYPDMTMGCIHFFSLVLRNLGEYGWQVLESVSGLIEKCEALSFSENPDISSMAKRFLDDLERVMTELMKLT
jgi:hypothetical protein